MIEKTIDTDNDYELQHVPGMDVVDVHGRVGRPGETVGEICVRKAAEGWFKRVREEGVVPRMIGKHPLAIDCLLPWPQSHMLMWVDGRCAGYAGIFPEGDDGGEVGQADVYVFPDYRRQGLATYLLGWLTMKGMDPTLQKYSTAGLRLMESFLDGMPDSMVEAMLSRRYE
jgi:GNAT superfamily N-acetyltransferase